MAASPRLEYIQFTRPEEHELGADWLWWWVDGSGECYGMLVQAKKLHRRGIGWFIDFRYPSKDPGRQMESLFQAAYELQVAPAFMLYTGDVEYRSGLRCGQRHSEPDCGRCERACVSVIGALAARWVVGLSDPSYPGTSAVDAFHYSSPLEDLADPDASPRLIRDLNLGRHLGVELRDFLCLPQSGARQVAKAILAHLSLIRMGQASHVVADRLKVNAAMVFDDLPVDAGHFSEPYFVHALRGLRTSLPDYVSDLALGRAQPQRISELVGGIVIVHL